MPAKSAVEDRRLHLHEGVVAQDQRQPAEDRHHDGGDHRHPRQLAGQQPARRERREDRRHEDRGGEQDLLELALGGRQPLGHRRHAVGEEEDRDRPDLERELQQRMDAAFGHGHRHSRAAQPNSTTTAPSAISTTRAARSRPDPLAEEGPADQRREDHRGLAQHRRLADLVDAGGEHDRAEAERRRRAPPTRPRRRSGPSSGGSSMRPPAGERDPGEDQAVEHEEPGEEGEGVGRGADAVGVVGGVGGDEAAGQRTRGRPRAGAGRGRRRVAAS